MIKLFDPHVTNEEVEAAKDVILSRNWASGAGTNKVEEFETALKNYLSSSEIVAVNSGTAALDLAVSLFDVKDKDVLVPSLTFVSTAHAAVYNGGNPVFVDVDPKTLCMDPDDLLRKINKKSAIVIPVHFGGMPCEMDTITRVCRENEIAVIDDAAHACGATYEEKRIGCIGDLTCLSFHPVKNLAMPTGGAISINKPNAESLKKRLNSSRWCGIDNRQGHTYDVTSVAPNYYMNEISAAIGLVQLRKLDRLNARRREIAKRYSKELNLESKMPFSNDCIYHLYWIISERREELLKYLTSKGIEAGTHYRPIHTMTAYRDRSTTSKVPITDEIGRKIITIPIHPNMSEDDVSFVIKTINSFT